MRSEASADSHSGWRPRSGRRARLAVLFLVAGAAVAAGEEPQAGGLDAWFPHLRVGIWVKVAGKRTPEGILDATKIKILDGELDEVEVESWVDSVDVVRMTVETALGVRVVATSSTKLEGPKPQRLVSFAFLMAGDRVDVEGQLQKDGSLVAEDIEIEKSKRVHPDLEPENKHELTSRIESIDAEKHRIVVMGVPVQLSESTKNKTPLLD